MLPPVLALLTLAIIWSSCGRDKKTDSPVGPGDTGKGATGTVEFAVSFAPWHPFAAKEAAVEAVDMVTAYVYDNEENDIAEQKLEISGGRAKGNITVTAQNDLRVALAYFEKDTVKYLGEDTDVDVPARGSTTADIIEQYMGTSVIAPDTAYVGREYRISWMKRPFAEYYELQESVKPDFSDAWTLYADTDTTYVVEAKRESDALYTFYYRARVWTKYGAGPWHGVGATGVAGLEGTIIIDVPLPPEEPSGGKSLKLTSPSGGDILTSGSIRDITWTSAGINQVKLEYSKDFGITWIPLATSLDAAAGSWSWTLPAELIPACFVRITDLADQKTTSKNDLPFSIITQSTPQTLLLAVPNGGETFSAETTREIIWTSRGVDKLDVDLTRDGGKTWISLAMNINAAPGKFQWNVPDLPSANCYIRVRASGDSLISDSSDQKFTLSTVTPSVTVLSPNGGETLDGYSYIPISWKSTGIDNVQIEYSTDGGTTWKTGPSSATKSWQANTCEWFTANESSTRCLIRVRDSRQSYATDTSDLPFTLNKISRSITVTYPQERRYGIFSDLDRQGSPP